MQRFGAMVILKPDQVEKYKTLHTAVWPKVLEVIAECHIHNYTIFLRDNILFSYFEYHGEDINADMDYMAADPTTQEWWACCVPCFEGANLKDRSSWWKPLEEVFHLD